MASDAAIRAGAKGLHFVKHWDPALPESIIGDERYRRQVLQHMLRNAVKFTARGELSVAADIENGSSGSRLRIKVKDSGIGIAEDKLRVIFQAFRQLDSGLARSYSGLGLGLALSDKLVRLMGGEISVESEIGAGTAFTIRLPMIIPMHAVKPPSPDSGPAPASSGRRGQQDRAARRRACPYQHQVRRYLRR